MSEFLDKALGKLSIKGVSGRRETVMAKPVLDVLADFCRQDEEFAQAVAQGGSFADCMKAVAQGVGDSISDIEAFRRAARFYFPGAEIRVQMVIDLVGEAGGGPSQSAAPTALPDAGRAKSEGIILDFTDFL